MTAAPPLDPVALARALGEAACRFDIDLLPSCDSTNAILLARAEAGAPSGSVVATENQTAGRGRRGRAWLSAPGESLTFSLLWRLPKGTSPAGLSLAVGVAVVRTLEQEQAAGQQGGADETTPWQDDREKNILPAAADGKTAGAFAPQLKWPNDILLDGKKLGGILLELVPGAPHAAVIGVGLNLRLPDGLPEDIRRQATALNQPLDRNDLLANLLKNLLTTLEAFAAGGFAVLREDWLQRHAFQDQPVQLLSDFSPPRIGLCRGVAPDGALLLEIGGRLERILSGEISLRPVS